MAAIVAGAVGGSIPNIFGGFAPFPNTIATALLAYQSEAIGFGFGIKFQYAKRKIGALTNAEFNQMNPIDVGNIVEAHNTELINRMASQMPKWLEIQDHYIEAGVAVEIAKAERTPSAWAEIITAFAGAASEQVVASLNALAPEALALILATNPILALIYSLGGGSGGSTSPPPPDPEPIPDELPIHDPDEDPFHPPEEHDQNALELTVTDFTILAEDQNSLRHTFQSPNGNYAQHNTLIITLTNDPTLIVDISGVSWGTAWQQNVLSKYRTLVASFYNRPL